MKQIEPIMIFQRGILCQGCGKVMVSTTPMHRVEFKLLGRTISAIACMDCEPADLEAAYKPIN